MKETACATSTSRDLERVQSRPAFDAKHMLRLETVGYYKAPGHDHITPHMIPKGVEYIEFMVGGTVYFDRGSGLEPFGAGAVFWHLEGDHTIHRNNPDDPYECVTMKFSVDGSPGRIRSRLSFWDEPESARAFADSVLLAYHDDSFDRTLLAHYAYSTLAWMERACARKGEQSSVPPPLMKVLSKIDDFGRAAPSVVELAAAAGVSVPHLHTLFRKHLRISPHKYMLGKRLQRAKALLAKTSLRVKEVGDECGFVNIETFCRSFKKAFGVTPAHYRRGNAPERMLRQ